MGYMHDASMWLRYHQPKGMGWGVGFDTMYTPLMEGAWGHTGGRAARWKLVRLRVLSPYHWSLLGNE